MQLCKFPGLVLLLVIIKLSLESASPAFAQSDTQNGVIGGSEAELSYKFGNSRLLFRSLLDSKQAELTPVVDALAKSLSYGENVSLWQPKLSFSVSPKLSYDDNINGGLPFDEIALGPFVFKVDDESRAKAGFLTGLQGDLAMHMSLAKGVTLQSHASLGGTYAPKHDIGQKTFNLGTCISKMAENWAYIETCIRRTGIKRHLNAEYRTTASLKGGRIFRARGALHDLNAEISMQDYKGERQSRIKLGGTSVVSGFGALQYSVLYGEKIEGVQMQTRGFDLSYSTVFAGRPSTISLLYAKEDGSKVFGMMRVDKKYVLRLSREIQKSLSAFVAVEKTDSTVSAFSHVSLEAGFSFRKLQW